MKKIGILFAIALFTINLGAQETKPATKEKAKKESCCAKKGSKEKKCDATMAKAEGKKCGTKA